jgi:hypothetical protein
MRARPLKWFGLVRIFCSLTVLSNGWCIDYACSQPILFPMRIANFKSWLPIAIAAIVAVLLYYVVSGRCGELLAARVLDTGPFSGYNLPVLPGALLVWGWV